MTEQVDDVVGVSHRVQPANIVRSTVTEQADDVFKGIVEILFQPTTSSGSSKGWLIWYRPWSAKK